MQIKLVRHGQSMANVGLVDAAAVGDHAIELTDTGHAQARATGARIGRDYLLDALIYTSPFRRARDTLAGVLDGAGLPRGQTTVYEDPRLREVEHGYADVPAQDAMRRTHGWFYYRFHGGESPADCYDRTSGFLESQHHPEDRIRPRPQARLRHRTTRGAAQVVAVQRHDAHVEFQEHSSNRLCNSSSMPPSVVCSNLAGNVFAASTTQSTARRLVNRPSTRSASM